MEIDVLVIGGGAAGIAAATAAARNGSTVALIERYGFLGGMATAAAVGTVCGLYYRSESQESRYICSGFSKEFGQELSKLEAIQPIQFKNGLHFLPYTPFAFRTVADRIINRDRIDLYLHTTMTDVRVNDDLIKTIQALVWDKQVTFYPKSVIDCSGEATVTALAGGRTRESDCYQAAAFVFAMAGIEKVESSVLQMVLIREIKRAISKGTLSQDCERLTIVPGSHVGNRVSFKLGLADRVDKALNKMTFLEVHVRSLVNEIANFLKKNTSIFSNAILTEAATQVGIRTGRRPIGLATLTEEDVLSCRRFNNGIAKGAWPIEEWSTDRKPNMRYFSLDDYYEIPSDALRSEDFGNLLFAGRNISATDAAIASARVIGTCLSTGYAAGKIAAFQSQCKDLTFAVEELRKEQVK